MNEDPNLATRLIEADRNLRNIERDVEEYLTRILPDGWHGWSFGRIIRAGRGSREIAIDIYETRETLAVVLALQRQGFDAVTLHNHISGKFMECDCRVHSHRMQPS